MDTPDKINLAVGGAATVIPLALDGLNIQLPPSIYWGMLGIGILCLSYAFFHGILKNPAFPIKKIRFSPATESIHPTIQYDESHAISEGEHDGHGYFSGQWHIARIKVGNEFSEALHNVSVAITSLVKHDENFPQYLLGALNIPLQLSFSGSTEEAIILNPKKEKFVDIFHFHRYPGNHMIMLGARNGTTVDCVGGPFAIKIQATSQEGPSEKAEFVMGLFGRSDGFVDPYFEPVFLPGMTNGQLRDSLIKLSVNGDHLRNEDIPTEPMRGMWEERYEIWLLQLLQTAKWFDLELRNKILSAIENRWMGYQQAIHVIPKVIAITKAHLGMES